MMIRVDNNRTPSWYRMDSYCETHTSNLQEALHDLHLDYTVITKSCAGIDPMDPDNPVYIPHRCVTVRSDTNEPLGIVSDRYRVVQNQEAFSFINDIPDINIIAGGHTSWNSVWLIGELPEALILGDRVRPNLIFQTSHDGSVPLRATICMLRILCQNQFSAAFENSPSTVKVHHKGDTESKIAAASRVLSGVDSYIRGYHDLAENLSTKKLTPSRFNKFLDTFFRIPTEGTESTIRRAEEVREDFMMAYDSEDNQNFKSTRWGIVNAYTDYMTHRVTKNPESVFFDTMESRTLPEIIKMLVA